MIHMDLRDFVPHKTISATTIEKYRDKVPHDIVKVWEQYGTGSIKNGYIKWIDPDEYADLVTISYFRGEGSIPLFATSMCDIITFEENKYLRLVKYRKGGFSIIPTSLTLFFSDLLDEAFCNRHLDWAPYGEAIDRLGIPSYEEGFGYVPLLGLGGAEKLEYLQKVRIFEHIQLITECMGAIK
ncbi:T6SS immunity protein Tdi1 domain-containing protein [Gorillibacterium sp. CAU 1737]|uniref:T6SS immunity protein Tdi1 domain-containing protein n=1 Tax=Gorillibacterium sp. CAU 1737 TaxID=3140362 RepID=UPI003261BBCD